MIVSPNSLNDTIMIPMNGLYGNHMSRSISTLPETNITFYAPMHSNGPASSNASSSMLTSLPHTIFDANEISERQSKKMKSSILSDPSHALQPTSMMSINQLRNNMMQHHHQHQQQTQQILIQQMNQLPAPQPLTHLSLLPFMQKQNQQPTAGPIMFQSTPGNASNVVITASGPTMIKSNNKSNELLSQTTTITPFSGNQQLGMYPIQLPIQLTHPLPLSTYMSSSNINGSTVSGGNDIPNHPPYIFIGTPLTTQNINNVNNINSNNNNSITNIIHKKGTHTSPKEQSQISSISKTNRGGNVNSTSVSSSTPSPKDSADGLLATLSNNSNNNMSIMRSACERCTQRKTKCIRISDNNCKSCEEKGLCCVFTPQRKRGRPTSVSKLENMAKELSKTSSEASLDVSNYNNDGN